jgi:hypothetical protein
LRIPESHLDIDTRADDRAIERRRQISSFRVAKQLLFTSDEHREVAADIEGMTLLSDRSLLLVSDNDFGRRGQGDALFPASFPAAFVDA